MSKRKRQPSSTCARCGETLDAIGGKRVVATAEHGVLVCGPEVALGELHHPAQTARVKAKEPLFLVTWGGPWTDEARARALEETEQGFRPWICQRCAERTCRTCGAPLEYPIASTLLADDGAVTHLMIVPQRVLCINPDCASRRVT